MDYIALQVVFFVGVQLDITKVDPIAPKSSVGQAADGHSPRESQAAETIANSKEGLMESRRETSGQSLGIINGDAQQQKAHNLLTSSTENLLAGLRLLSPSGHAHSEEKPQEPCLQRREEVGPREKQMQRSVIGTVSISRLRRESS